MRRLKRWYRIYEDEEENNNDAAIDAANSDKIAKANNAKVALNTQKNTLKKEYDTKIAAINTQINKLDQDIADAGGNVPNENIEESLRTKFSKRLYESVQGTKTEEMTMCLKLASENLPNLSYQLDDTRCMTYAKKIISFINSADWGYGENHWDELDGFIREIISRGYTSFSRRELNEFMGELEDILSNNTLFNWFLQ
jgi:hypothetical protein